MSKHFIQLLKLFCLLSVFVSCFSTFRIYKASNLLEVWLHDRIISKLHIHGLKDSLLPSLLLMCLPSVCLGDNKPNPRDDVQCVQSTQGALYTCTVLPIISETVQTRKSNRNKRHTGPAGVRFMGWHAPRAGTQRTFVPGSCLKSYILAALHHWLGTAAARG